MSLINFSGLASGIDSESLIKATSDAARAGRVKPKQDQITALEDEDTSLDELRALVGELQDKAKKFRLINGTALVKTASSSDETVATVAASNGTANTSFSITVAQLARTGTFSYNDRFTSTTTPIAPTLSSTGSPNDQVTIQVGLGSEMETTTITISATTTLDQLASAINAASTNTKAIASVVNVADPGSAPLTHSFLLV